MNRTKSTLALAIALLASLGLGAVTVAQAAEAEFAGSGPLGSDVTFRPINAIAGQAVKDHIIDPGTLKWKGNLRKIRNQISELTMDWSTPGLPDTIQALWNSDEYQVPGQSRRAKIHAGTFLLRDDTGSWAGPFGGVEYVDGSTDLQATLIGALGYAGQCAILNVLRSTGRGWEMDGLVFDCESLQTME